VARVITALLLRSAETHACRRNNLPISYVFNVRAKQREGHLDCTDAEPSEQDRELQSSAAYIQVCERR
jgi:hypothetical protein